MDAINALVAGTQRAQATLDAAARQIAAADLPTSAAPDPTNPAVPDPAASVDIAAQLTTLMIAADAHHLTTAALRSALSMYQDSIALLG